MADQFCRIVCTSVCDGTLDSNQKQAILTTDANTSYVVRDVYKEDSSDYSGGSFSGYLEMDGINVSSLSTSTSGSLIVPPSTTLSYVDTSNNFPVAFNCFCMQASGCCAFHGFHLKNMSTTPEAVEVDACVGCCGYNCLSCTCCNGDFQYGYSVYLTEAQTLLELGHDGNSQGTTWVFCKNPTSTSRSLTWTCSTGYCKGAATTDGVYAHADQCVLRVWDWVKNPCAGNSTPRCICTCATSCTPTTYAEFAISGRHPCYPDANCRAFLYSPSPGDSNARTAILTVNLCCDNLCTTMEVPFCKTNSSVNRPWYGPESHGFVYYSKYLDGWTTGAFTQTYLKINGLDGSELVTYTFPTIDPTAGDCHRYYAISDDKIVFPINSSCYLRGLSLDSILDGTAPTDELPYLSDTPYTTGCFNRPTGGYSCQSARFAHGIPVTGLNACDYPAGDVSTKIRAYGIKST